MKKFLGMLLFPLVLFAAAPALAEQVEIDRVVAIVGQSVITLSEVQTEMAPAFNELSQTYRGEELAVRAQRLQKNALNGLVDKYLQLQEAKTAGVEVSDEEVDAAIQDVMKKNSMDKAAFVVALQQEGFTFEDYRKTLSDQLLIMRLVQHEVKSKISLKEEDIKNYYEANKDRLGSPESLKVAAISFPAAKDGGMTAAQEKARAAKKDIDAGASFEETAAKCTGDPGASKTCVLGVFVKGELSKEIEDKAFGMKAGEVSDPIETSDGYRLIKVLEHTPGGASSLEEARAKIIEDLSARQGEAFFAKWLQELRSRTYVEIRL